MDTGEFSPGVVASVRYCVVLEEVFTPWVPSIEYRIAVDDKDKDILPGLGPRAAAQR